MIWGQSLSAEPHFGTSFASLWVGGFCLATAAFAYFRLPESLPSIANKTAEMAHADSSTKTDASSATTNLSTETAATSVFDSLLQRFRQMVNYGQRPLLGAMIFIFFLNTMAFAQMESTLVLLVKEKFLWTTKDITFGFGYIGLISVFCQGYLVRKLIPIFGERKLLAFGLLTLSLSLLGIGFAPTIPMLAVVMTTLSVGSSFTNPNILGSVSLLSGAEEQGMVMGTAQGVASLGRILGPVLGGALYQFFPSYMPFIAGFGISFGGFLLVTKLYARLPESGKQAAKINS
jgi:predicted MFS family arabinose efflux permease